MYKKKIQVITDYDEDRFQSFLQRTIEKIENNADADDSSISIKYQFTIDSDEHNGWYSALITWKQWEEKGKDEL
jgi:uncharacterized beta-barrel protein YwiB (DUF1934 family)